MRIAITLTKLRVAPDGSHATLCSPANAHPLKVVSGRRNLLILDFGDAQAEIKSLGGAVVLVDGPDIAKRVAAETANAAIPLALDGASDTSSMNLMSCLSESGVLVSYGAMSRKPMMVNPGTLIYRKQTIRSFWLHFWYQSARPEEITSIFDRLAPMVADGTISAPVAATFGFDQAKEAITQAAQSRGKVLFRADT